MDSDLPQIADACDIASLRDEITEVLRAFEQSTGCLICIRTFSDCWLDDAGQLVTSRLFNVHRSTFCEVVKKRDQAACLKCDFIDLPRICLPPPNDAPFVRTCHAGADEVLVPLWDDGVLVAVLFVGQFQKSVPGVSGNSELRQLDDEEVQRLRNLTLPLRSYMLDVLRRLNGRRRAQSLGRRGVIELYIRQTLPRIPALPELAEQLSLSPSRASHVVRELTGQSFQQLVESRRLSIAQDLLARSGAKVAWIAEQAGFNNTAYFCRYFKSRTGMTPMAYRKKHRRIDAV